jgi:hypothetical protein
MVKYEEFNFFFSQIMATLGPFFLTNPLFKATPVFFWSPSGKDLSQSIPTSTSKILNHLFSPFNINYHKSKNYLITKAVLSWNKVHP